MKNAAVWPVDGAKHDQKKRWDKTNMLKKHINTEALGGHRCIYFC